MWPYPSAAGLHLGHAINYMPTDTHARYKKMCGYNVFEPIGFDAFGLPAENYAIKTGTHPHTTTDKNVANMRGQLHSLGCMFDPTRELNSSDPTYYKWTQTVFLELYKRGLAYQKEAPTNWCPHCNTVIANEQVLNGECERCHNKIEKRNMKQWFLKITDFAEPLLKNLETLDWPNKIKTMQTNWIGKSVGHKVKFGNIEVFTTRADTIDGVSFIVLAPEHPLAKSYKNCAEYVKNALNKTEIDRTAEKIKSGVFTGDYVVNPYNNEKVPIWIADYVLGNYGTGAVMGVPNYDDRDKEFATKYKIPIPKRKLIDPKNVGKAVTTYRLRDWSIGRQRYWGCPIPIVHCDKCGAVPETNLPVKLPELKDYLPHGKPPLANDKNFVTCNCPKCGKPATRETETMDTFVCSSFYFYRFLDTTNEKELISKDRLKFMPVDMYVGGAEHACMHLLYARFIALALYGKEPFQKLINQGMILGPDGTKMSKSRGNIIEPDKYIEEFGSDLLRLYMLFGFNYREGGPWNDSAFKSVVKFPDRINNLFNKITKDTQNIIIKLNQTIKQVAEDLENFNFNTAVAACMELVNLMVKDGYSKKTLETLVLLLAPMLPHISSEWWEQLGQKTDIFNEKFPTYDKTKLQSDTVEIVVQINSKIKTRITISNNATQNEVIKLCNISTFKKVIYIQNRLINFIV
jgi:leucyl-tRNA synthetase